MGHYQWLRATSNGEIIYDVINVIYLRGPIFENMEYRVKLIKGALGDENFWNH